VLEVGDKPNAQNVFYLSPYFIFFNFILISPVKMPPGLQKILNKASKDGSLTRPFELFWLFYHIPFRFPRLHDFGKLCDHFRCKSKIAAHNLYTHLPLSPLTLLPPLHHSKEENLN
jgi:hypothetical protein